MRLEWKSPCKVNLILNILGRRPDGFHELETVMQPVQICDSLTLERLDHTGLELTCSDPALPSDHNNLVHRAAFQFLQVTKISDGIRIHLEKRIPLAAGLGGGSSNAANAVVGLNELLGRPLTRQQLVQLAISLGSDVPFFLQSQPALALGRGEQITPLPPFPAFRNVFILLIHPGFGISTKWSYENLALFPEALHGRAGRAERLIALLNGSDLNAVGRELYNSLELPAFKKYPILAMYQEFLREHGAAGTLMSGSGSTTFALFQDRTVAENAVPPFQKRFGSRLWMAVLPLS